MPLRERQAKAAQMTEALQSRNESGLRLQQPSCSKRRGAFAGWDGGESRTGTGSHTRAKSAGILSPSQSCSFIFELLLKLRTKDGAFDVGQSTRALFSNGKESQGTVFFMCVRTARGNYLQEGCLRRDRAERKEAAAMIYSGAELWRVGGEGCGRRV